MFTLLDFPLQHTRPLWFIKSRDFEDLRSIQVTIGTTTHHSDITA
jgi:hypothetical protein